MRRQGMGWLAAGVLVLASVSCYKDPVKPLQGGATRLIVSRSSATVSVPDSLVITTQVVDQQGNYLTFGAPTVTTLDPTIANIIPFPDSIIGTIPGNTLRKLEIVAVSAGQTKVTVTVDGLTDTVGVLVFPRLFTGTITPTTVHPGDTVTFTAPTNVTFNPASATANVGALGFYKLVSATSTTLKMIAGASGPVPYSITGAILLGTYPITSLTPGTALTVTENKEPANDTASVRDSTIAMPVNVGDTTTVFASLDSAVDAQDFYTLAPTNGDSVQIRIDWPSTALDLNGYLLLTSGSGTPGGTWPCVVSSGTGCPMATAAGNPEVQSVRLTGGTSYKLLVTMAHGGTRIGYRILVIRKA